MRTKPDAKARKTYWQNGKYIVEEIEVSDDFRVLNLLLFKVVYLCLILGY